MKPARLASRGFTLIELTVSLVAGLFVALGIMTLSKEATRTFNEEMRGAGAEAALRTASDRLRADLSRAGYMSTANFLSDPMIAHAPGALNQSNVPGGLGGILRLASISLVNGQTGASQTLNQLPLSLVQPTPLAPDAFEIGGNLTTAEQFQVVQILPAGGNCTQILLSANSAAMYRIAAAGLMNAAASNELRNAFQPIPAGLSNQFIVRLQDTTGHTQYLATCPMPAAAGITGGQPFVWVDTVSTPIQTAYATQTQGGMSGYCGGCIVNPVQIVRWEITTAAQGEQAQYGALAATPLGGNGGALDTTKYDLVRSFVDATGNVVPSTSEIIAEYAVDLKLAFSVDQTAIGDLSPKIATFAFDDGQSTPYATTSVVATPNVGPQRIRSARVRIVTRAALPDRTVNLPATELSATQPFLYRYCVNATPSCGTNDGTLRWARARTMTLEVALPNTSMAYY